MDNVEKTIEKRKKILKVGAALLTIYGLCVTVFFILNALGVINIFNIADYETNRMTIFSTIGTCGLGVLTGLMCLVKRNAPDWYNILYIMSVCTMALLAFVGVSHGSTFGNFGGLIIIYIELAFACVCAFMTNKLRGKN